MSADHDSMRRLLGGYLLGGLDELDTDRLDEHLHYCDDCRDELERLAAVPELLQRLPDAKRSPGAAGAQPMISMSTQPSPENVEGLLRRMRAARSRETRMARVRWLAAAGVVLLAVAIGLGVFRTNRINPPAQVAPSPQLVTAQFEAAEGSGLSGEAVLTPKTWGVSVAIDVTRLSGHPPFRCQVRSMGGREEQAAIWGSTPSGGAKVIGASSIQLPDVRSVSVVDQDGVVRGTADVD